MTYFFERFLNPDRKSMPDIDTDFDDEGRQKVIDYVVNKYGKQQVAHIVTYGTMAAKMSIKDVARVMDLPLADANNMAKLVSDKPGIKLNRLLTAPLTGEGSLTDEGKKKTSAPKTWTTPNSSVKSSPIRTTRARLSSAKHSFWKVRYVERAFMRQEVSLRRRI